MSYVPTNWQTGDTITAEKLNNIEGGIEASSPVIFKATCTLNPDSGDVVATFDNDSPVATIADFTSFTECPIIVLNLDAVVSLASSGVITGATAVGRYEGMLTSGGIKSSIFRACILPFAGMTAGSRFIAEVHMRFDVGDENPPTLLVDVYQEPFGE